MKFDSSLALEISRHRETRRREREREKKEGGRKRLGIYGE